MSPHLLHIDASPRGRSHSRAVGRAFADAWRAAGGTVTYRDVAAVPIPHITEAHTELSTRSAVEGVSDYTGLSGLPNTPEQHAAWAVSGPLLAELQAAEVLLIGAPMYNFGIPAALKAWIDAVTFAGVRLGPRVGVVAAAHGGSYGPGAPREPFDYQMRYLRDYLTSYGPEDVRFLTTELTLAPVVPALAELADQHHESRTRALADAGQLADELAGKLARAA